MLEGRPFVWADVVLAELHRGAWAELEQRTRAGLAARRAAVASGRELSAAETTAAARAFRFERGLLAGEQLDEWLEGWGIGLAEWREYLRRDLLRGRSTGAGEVGDDEVSAAIGVEAICSGVLEAAAGRLAAQAALAPPGAGPAGARRPRGRGRGRGAARDPAGAVRGASRAGRAASRPRRRSPARSSSVDDAVADELARHRQEWLRLELGVLALDDVDAAREALLCLRRRRARAGRRRGPGAARPAAPLDDARRRSRVARPVRRRRRRRVGDRPGSTRPGVRGRRRRVEARAEPGRSGRSRARRGVGRGARGSTAGRRQDRVA